MISDGFFTGVLGLACFVSLPLMKRPLMFYVRRQFLDMLELSQNMRVSHETGSSSLRSGK